MNEPKGYTYKGFMIYFGPTSSLYQIKTVGSGKMPKVLKSMFTDVKNGRLAIDMYLATKPKLRLKKKAEIKE